MNSLAAVPESPASARTALRLGAWAAALTAVAAAVALAIGGGAPPRSGTFCATGCITYPYTDVAAFVPGDYLWMYPALLVAALLVVLVACVAWSAPAGRRLVGLTATAFAVVAAASLAIDYTVQLAAVQPSLLRGETDGLTLLSMYNPHGFFIALEDLGYFCVDNLPPRMIGSLGELFRHEGSGVERAAGVSDGRGGGYFDDRLEGLEDAAAGVLGTNPDFSKAARGSRVSGEPPIHEFGLVGSVMTFGQHGPDRWHLRVLELGIFGNMKFGGLGFRGVSNEEYHWVLGRDAGFPPSRLNFPTFRAPKDRFVVIVPV